MERKYISAGVVIFVVLAGAFLYMNLNSSQNDNSPGEESLISEYPELAGDPNKTTIYFFWGNGCPHCADEEDFFIEIEEKYSGEIEIKDFETYNHPENAQILQKVAAKYNTQARGVPMTFIGNKHWTGFSESTGNKIESQIQYCIENKCSSPLES